MCGFVVLARTATDLPIICKRFKSMAEKLVEEHDLTTCAVAEASR